MAIRHGSVPVVLAFAFGVLGCGHAEHSRVAEVPTVPDVSAHDGPDLGARFDARPRSEQQRPELVPADPTRLATELAELRKELPTLDGGLKTLVHALARERVEVNQLKDKVDDLTAKQTAHKDRLAAGTEAIKKADDTVTLGNRVLTVADAKAELEADRKRFEAGQKLLAAHETLVANRVKVRASLEQQVDALKQQKAELRVALDLLDAELAKGKTDADRLARVQKELNDLRAKFDAEREKLKLLPKPMEKKS